jgi:hypothetical protein
VNPEKRRGYERRSDRESGRHMEHKTSQRGPLAPRIGASNRGDGPRRPILVGFWPVEPLP